MNHKSTSKLILIAVVVLAAALACRGGGSSGVSAGSRPADQENKEVNVTAQEFEFVLDASGAKPGTVTFVVTNNGHMPHDFAISGNGIEEKTPMLDPGETARLEVTLEAGEFEFVCTVPGHAILGMRGIFTVAQ